MVKARIVAGLATVLFLLAIGWADYAHAQAAYLHFDIFPSYVAARELIRAHANPYGQQVLEAIQRDPEGSQARWLRFYAVGDVYPLPLLFIVWPFTLVPFRTAVVLWMLVAQFGVAVVLALLARSAKVSWPGAIAIGVGLSTIGFEPNFEGVYWAQFVHLAVIGIGMAELGLRWRKRWLFAVGAALSLARPQSSPPVVLLLLLLRHSKRDRLLRAGAFALVTGGVLLFSLAFRPDWPLSYIHQLLRWRSLTAHVAPIEVIARFSWLLALISVIGLASLLIAALRREDHSVTLLAIISMTLLVLPQSSTYSDAPLVIPWLALALRTHSPSLRRLTWFALLGFPWLVQIARIFTGPAGPWHLFPLPLMGIVLAIAHLRDVEGRHSESSRFFSPRDDDVFSSNSV